MTMAKRFKDELGYKHSYPFPIQKEGERGPGRKGRAGAAAQAQGKSVPGVKRRTDAARRQGAAAGSNERARRRARRGGAFGAQGHHYGRSQARAQ